MNRLRTQHHMVDFLFTDRLCPGAVFHLCSLRLYRHPHWGKRI